MLQVLVLLGISVVVLTLLARRMHVAPPIGAALAFVPWPIRHRPGEHDLGRQGDEHGRATRAPGRNGRPSGQTEPEHDQGQHDGRTTENSADVTMAPPPVVHDAHQ